ncbi:nuclear transport factor 2 family protein [Bradyrhizobium sp. 1(2017)]|uniref:nuclear transport factor 2 family protein n=1 Tax=Bradyrhizobium sp. 1(2017) TaxID=1404888 RepID=UPI00140F2AA6|nr:nuclear transport factor 2 family protein [Bradyrhizobium sp. 1(2017)]QIO36901.1 nuclear transport factor 2 family protein [Bradyrhizobium sp. 1(2017)]
MSTDKNEATEADYDTILRANAERVFSERDPAARRRALDQLWLPDGILYEDGHAVTGLDAISDTVGALLDTLPPGMTFAAVGPAVGHHGLGRLRWQAKDGSGNPTPIWGTDVGIFRDGKIAQLYVLLDPAQ